MQTNEGNPAGRLLLVLRHFEAKADSESNLTVLSEYFGLEPQPTPQLYTNLSALLNLPGEARAAFGRANAQQDLMPFDETMSEFSKSEDALLAATTLENSCLEVKKRFDAGTLMALTFISRSIGAVESDPIFTVEDENQIRSAATALVEAIREADDVPAESRRILLEHAEAVLHALNLVKIGGTGTLLKERDRLEGHTRRQPNTFIAAFRNNRVGQALIALSIVLAGAAGVTHEAVEIEGDIQHFFKELQAVPPSTDATRTDSGPSSHTSMESP